MRVCQPSWSGEYLAVALDAQRYQVVFGVRAVDDASDKMVVVQLIADAAAARNAKLSLIFIHPIVQSINRNAVPQGLLCRICYAATVCAAPTVRRPIS
jgi:hypothetical protein